ncbi:thioredoxin-like protein [Radiomyces spectabilis]|uniref:thioredoxin-like protein n=1 Tax=Radiomyces spectabilis TaxID=64574 RepID=UPI00221FBC59|nr:thioredoxin-like protein [Radiomyces spectabilis]KAI8393671.1 thioredoxin-like protein [Radiomyces spectabilis]
MSEFFAFGWGKTKSTSILNISTLPHFEITMSLFKSQLSKGIKELRVQFCQTSPASSGLRDFVAKNYTALKKANPELPILIREASGAEARVFARFEKGVERKAVLQNTSAQDVEKVLEQLVKSA